MVSIVAAIAFIGMIALSLYHAYLGNTDRATLEAIYALIALVLSIADDE